MWSFFDEVLKMNVKISTKVSEIFLPMPQNTTVHNPSNFLFLKG